MWQIIKNFRKVWQIPCFKPCSHRTIGKNMTSMLSGCRGALGQIYRSNEMKYVCPLDGGMVRGWPSSEQKEKKVLLPSGRPEPRSMHDAGTFASARRHNLVASRRGAAALLGRAVLSALALALETEIPARSHACPCCHLTQVVGSSAASARTRSKATALVLLLSLAKPGAGSRPQLYLQIKNQK